MKKFLPFCILFILFCPSLFAGSNPEWRRVDSTQKHVTRWYSAIKCADSMNCVVLAYTRDEDPILRSTTDGGETWKDIYIDSTRGGYDPFERTTSIWLKDIAYPSKNLILAIGDSGLVIRSTDQGATWEKKRFGDYYYHMYFQMLNDKYGIIITYNDDKKRDEYLETKDGGATWSLMDAPAPYNDTLIVPYVFTILKEGHFIAKFCNYGGGNYNIAHVYGNWDSIITCPDPYGNYGYLLHFADENRGWKAGIGPPSKPGVGKDVFNQVIRYTNDGGKSWITQRDTFMGGLSIISIDFYDDRFGIVGSEIGQAYFTHNGGKTWEDIQIDDYPYGAFFRVDSPQLTSYSSGYAIVDLQYVYKFTRDWSIPHDTSGSPDDSVKSFFPSPPLRENMIGNYPNPFSDKTKIVYYLAEPGPATITIFDLQGQKLETVFDGYAGEGFHEIEYANKSLSPGFYYYRLRAGGKVVTRKMLIIR